LCLLDARGELLAYLVFRRGENTLYVGDFLFRDPRWLEVLLAEFLRLARRERAEAAVVVYLGSSQVCQALGQFGFWQRPSDWKAMIYADPQRPTHEVERLLTVENWHITRADLDTDE
jgi:hypothetical protein